MPKRSLSVETPCPAKRRKGQQSIADFFGTSPKSKGNATIPDHRNISREIIDVDLFEEKKPFDPPMETGSPSKTPTKNKQKPPLTVQSLASTLPRESFAHIDLTVEVVEFKPSPKPWSSKDVPYSFLAHTLATISQTRSRISIISALTNCLRTIIYHDSASLLPALYLLSNTLAPSYATVEMGLGPTIISRSIQQVSGLTSAAVKRLYHDSGDPGDVAFAAKSNLRTLLPHPPLLVKSVYKSLLDIAHSKGTGAAKSKQRIVERLLIAANGEEIRFLTRTLSQNLRVGAVRTSILIALSRAMVLTPPTHISGRHNHTSFYHVSSELISHVKPVTDKGNPGDDAREQIYSKFAQAEQIIKRVYVQHPNYQDIVTALLVFGLDGLENQVSLTVGIPLHPALGSPTRSLQEIYDILKDRPFSAEFKYDGQRAQIHGYLEGGKVYTKIFSRHLEDMTDKYPDIVSLVQSFFKATPKRTSFILDSEIVAIDQDNGTLQSFQTLSNRARKDVLLQNIRVSVCVFAFDVMYLDGESLLARTFRERRAILREQFPSLMPVQKELAQFKHVESCESEAGRLVVETFWEKAIASRCEGLMVKLLDNFEPMAVVDTEQPKSRRKPLPATYEPDKRTNAWLKLKRDYVTGLGDTLDLVPIGAWHGNGRKAAWWSPILLGLWNQDSGELVGVCKCMSGFTDAFYKALAERYQLSESSETCSAKSLWDCDVGGFQPAVYFKPQEVWEIRGADITMSPVSVAAKGMVSSGRGLSIRFPRFVRVREDKTIEQATTPESLVNMWRAQQKIGANKEENDEDGGELVDADNDDSEFSEDE